MNREQVKEVFKVLAFAYPRFEVSAEKIDYWHKFLADQDPAVVMKKAEKHIMNSVFPPAIAELREPVIQFNNDKGALTRFWGSEAQ